MPANELTEANRHPRYSCSKLLLTDATLIWFSDRMLFTLTTVNNLGNGIWCSEGWNVGAKTIFFRARM